jgi:hypothetical protein
MWSKLAATFVLFLVRIFAGPVAARDRAVADMMKANSKEQAKQKDAQLEIAARPNLDRDTLLERLRNGDL